MLVQLLNTSGSMFWEREKQHDVITAGTDPSGDLGEEPFDDLDEFMGLGSVEVGALSNKRNIRLFLSPKYTIQYQ